MWLFLALVPLSAPCILTRLSTPRKKSPNFSGGLWCRCPALHITLQTKRLPAPPHPYTKAFPTFCGRSCSLMSNVTPLLAGPPCRALMRGAARFSGSISRGGCTAALMRIRFSSQDAGAEACTGDAGWWGVIQDGGAGRWGRGLHG